MNSIDSAVRLLRDSNLVWSSDFSDVRLTLALLIEQAGQSNDLGVKAKALLVADQLIHADPVRNWREIETRDA